jgi:Cys-rich repeat protein
VGNANALEARAHAIPAIECGADAGALAAARLDAENLFSEAENLAATLGGQPATCSGVAPADSAVEAIKASAQLSLYAVGGIAQKADDCQARLASGQGGGGTGGRSEVPVDTVVGMFDDARGGRTPPATGVAPPPYRPPVILPPDVPPLPDVTPPGGGSGVPGGPRRGCRSNSDCAAGFVCANGRCVAAGGAGGQPPSPPASASTPSPGGTTPSGPQRPGGIAAPTGPIATRPPAVDMRKWYVWHTCGDKTGWWCILSLTQTTEADLKKRTGKITICRRQPGGHRREQVLREEFRVIRPGREAVRLPCSGCQVDGARPRRDTG